MYDKSSGFYTFDSMEATQKKNYFNDFIATGGKFQFNGVFNGFSETEKPLKTPLKKIILLIKVCERV
jgi:hypothetical protein